MAALLTSGQISQSEKCTKLALVCAPVKCVGGLTSEESGYTEFNPVHSTKGVNRCKIEEGLHLQASMRIPEAWDGLGIPRKWESIETTFHKRVKGENSFIWRQQCTPPSQITI